MTFRSDFAIAMELHVETLGANFAESSRRLLFKLRLMTRASTMLLQTARG